MLRTSRFVQAVTAVCAFVCLCAPARVAASEVSVFAAASLAEVLQSVAQEFEAASGHRLRPTFAGSSALARQIEYGAPADVFVSANAAWVSYLTESGYLKAGLEKTLYGSALVMIAPADRPVSRQAVTAAEPVTTTNTSQQTAIDQTTTKAQSTTMAQAATMTPAATELDYHALIGDGRLAMALVDAVPAGIYGRQALENIGVWQSLAPQVAQVDNVRSALALVALGEAAAGIVYATDAKADPRVQIVTEFPAELHDPIVYPVAVVTGQNRPEVIEFMSFWESEAVQSAFEAHGFHVLEAAE